MNRIQIFKEVVFSREINTKLIIFLLGLLIGMLWSDNAHSTAQDPTEARLARFEVNANILSPISFFDGKRQLGDLEIMQLLAYTIYKLPNIPNETIIAVLMLETARAESNSGKFNYKGRNKFGKGIWQVEVETAKCTLDWLKYAHKDVYKATMALYDHKQTLSWNLDFNAPFNCAMALNKYWRVAPDKLNMEYLQYIDNRAELWLSKYVTHNRNRQDLLYLSRNL